jgi:hypothetical protein
MNSGDEEPNASAGAPTNAEARSPAGSDVQKAHWGRRILGAFLAAAIAKGVVSVFAAANRNVQPPSATAPSSSFTESTPPDILSSDWSDEALGSFDRKLKDLP